MRSPDFGSEKPSLSSVKRRASVMGRFPITIGAVTSVQELRGDSNCKFSRENLGGLFKQTDGYPLRVSVGKRYQGRVGQNFPRRPISKVRRARPKRLV